MMMNVSFGPIEMCVQELKDDVERMFPLLSGKLSVCELEDMAQSKSREFSHETW